MCVYSIVYGNHLRILVVEPPAWVILGEGGEGRSGGGDHVVSHSLTYT